MLQARQLLSLRRGESAASHRRCLAAIVLTGAAALVASACGSSSPTSAKPTASAAKSPYVIHVINAVTGSVASVGLDNQAALKGLEQYVNSTGGIDGHQLHFAFSDNESTPSVAVSLASPLIGQHVPLMMVGGVGAVDKAVDALVTSSGPVVFDMSPVANPKPGSYVFSTTASAHQLFQVTFDYLADSGLTRVALLNATDATGADIADYVTKTQEPSNHYPLHIVAHESYDPSAASVTSQVQKIAASHPQAIIVPETGTTIEVAFKALQQTPSLRGVPVIVTSGDANTRLMQRFGPIVPQHMLVGGPPNLVGPHPALFEKIGVPASRVPLEQTFLKYTKDQLGGTYQIAWDNGMLAVNAVKKLGVSATAQQVHDYIEGLQSYDAVGGVMNFRQNPQRGLGLKDTAVFEWDGATNTLVPVSALGGRPIAHKSITSTPS